MVRRTKIKYFWESTLVSEHGSNFDLFLLLFFLHGICVTITNIMSLSTGRVRVVAVRSNMY